jgi:hypothetical protein
MNDDYAEKRRRGGRATADKRSSDGKFSEKRYHQPKSSNTPDISKGGFASDDGPQRDNKTGMGVKAWCYIHNTDHSFNECPTPLGKARAKADL